MVRGYGKGKFKSDKQRKAVMSKVNKKRIVKKGNPKGKDKKYHLQVKSNETGVYYVYARNKKEAISKFYAKSDKNIRIDPGIGGSWSIYDMWVVDE